MSEWLLIETNLISKQHSFRKEKRGIPDPGSLTLNLRGVYKNCKNRKKRKTEISSNHNQSRLRKPVENPSRLAHHFDLLKVIVVSMTCGWQGSSGCGSKQPSTRELCVVPCSVQKETFLCIILSIYICSQWTN